MGEGDDLFGPPREPEVDLALAVGAREARARGHATVRAEHVLLALLGDLDVVELLDQLGARVELIEAAIDEVLGGTDEPLVLGDDPPHDVTLVVALRRAGRWSRGGVDRRALLAALAEESVTLAGALSKAGLTPAHVVEATTARDPAVTSGAYRSHGASRPWTVRLSWQRVMTIDALVATMRALGASRAAASYAAARGELRGFVDVGRFAETEARHVAEGAEARAAAAGHALRAAATPRLADASGRPRVAILEASPARVVRWWRVVQALRFAALVALVAGAWSLVSTVRRSGVLGPPTISLDEALDGEEGRLVRLDVRPMGSPRFAPERGAFYLSDPRRPERLQSLYVAASPIHVDQRVIVDIYEPRAPSRPFVAERVIPGPTGPETARARWYTWLAPGYGDSLIVSTSSVEPRAGTTIEGVGRPIAYAGHDAAELARLYVQAGGQTRLTHVFDVDPLPPGGAVTRWIPVCAFAGVHDAACAPVLWARAEDLESDVTTFEGLLTTTDDERLRTSASAAGRPPRVLVMGARARASRVTRPSLTRAISVPGSGAVAVGLVLAVVARRVRRRRRPSA